jgi:hypothetical protein
MDWTRGLEAAASLPRYPHPPSPIGWERVPGGRVRAGLLWTWQSMRLHLALAEYQLPFVFG